MTPLTSATATRLEKAAVDNGFDQALARHGDWLGFASTQTPLRVWLRAFAEGVFIATFSQQNVARALGPYGTPIKAPLPKGALGGRTVTDIPALHRLLRRAFQLSKTLPDELLHSFEKQTAALPRATEAERLVIQRVGQDLFRQALLDLWEGRCAITGLAVPDLLRASHIKPWASCERDAERLDVWNGLLLAPHLDAAFDRGYLTVADDGSVLVFTGLPLVARKLLGLEELLRVQGLQDGHRAYLPWHREHVFRTTGAAECPSSTVELP
jgi:hypothetical protein